MDKNADIVITGIGAISAAGVGIERLREAVLKKACCLQPVPEEIVGEEGYLWGKADSFRGADYMPPLKARKLDRCSQLAVVATGMALRDARLEAGQMDPTRIGIVLGCGFGGVANSEEFLRGWLTAGADGLTPMLFPNTVPNAPASNASIEHRLKGPNVTVIQRFCSAETALLMARRFLEEDRADVILTGGVDELIPVMMKGFRGMGQLRTFGRNFGEGAGILVMERGEHALRRNAPVQGTIGAIRTIGRFVAGAEGAGAALLLPDSLTAEVVGLSGTAAAEQWLLDRLPRGDRLEVGPLLGRSLAMGGLGMAALLLTLSGRRGVHVAGSPEGPYYAIEFSGGASVRS